MRNSVRGAVVAVVALLLGVGGYLYWRSHRPHSAPADLISYLPPADDTLVFADVAALRQGGVMQLLDAMPVAEEAEYKNFVAQTGFKYQSDLDRALLLVQPARTLAVLDGRFNIGQLKKFAKAQGGKCDGDYCRLPSAQQGRIISFRPLGGQLLALASAPDGDAARLIGPSAHGAAPAQVPQQPIWISVNPSSLRSEDALPTGTKLFARVLTNTDRLLFTIGPEEQRYGVGLTVYCRNSHDAQIITEELQKLTTMLSSLILREKQKPNPGDLSGVLTAGTFRQSDTLVVGHWPVEPAFLQNLAGTAR